MSVTMIDHINIVAADLEETAGFYADLLDLERRDPPFPSVAATTQWMHDSTGHPVIHISSLDAVRARGDDVAHGQTGSVHHVALACQGYDAVLSRLEARGLVKMTNTVEAIGLRQIFARDPNGVLLELNFRGD